MSVPFTQAQKRWARIDRLRLALLLGPVAASACSRDLSLDFDRPWASSELALLVLTTPAGTPIQGAPIVAGPGEPITISVTYPEDFVVWVESHSPDRIAPNGARFDTCDFTFAGDGNVVESPSRRFSAGPFGDDRPDDPKLVEQPAGAERSFPLLHRSCTSRVDPCADLLVTTYDVDPPGRLEYVTVIDDRTAIAAGRRDAGAGMLIGRFDTDRFEPFGTRFLGAPSGIAWRDGAVWGVGGRPTGTLGNFWRVDENGMVLPTISATVSGTQRNIAAGSDGSVFFAGSESGLFELVTSTTSVARLDHPWAPRRMYAVDRQRIVTVDTSNDRVLRYFDGRGWTAEWNRQVSTRDPKSFWGDSTSLAMVGAPDIVALRDEDRRAWVSLPTWPRIGGDPDSVAMLVGRRLVVAGSEIGGLSMGTTERWCTASDIEPRYYRAVAAAPSGRVAFAVGYETLGTDTHHSVVVRIELVQ